MAGLFGQAGWSPDMAQEQAPPRLWGAVPGAQKGPGFFDTGGLGSKLLNGAGTFANTWLALSGNEGAQQSIHDSASMQHAAALRAQSLQDQRDTWLQQQQWERENPKPQDPHIVHMNNDDVLSIDARTGDVKSLAHGVPAQTETERMIEAASALPPNDPKRQLIERALRGAQFNPDVFRPMLDYKTQGQMQVKRTVPGKAPSVARPTSAPKPPAGFILD